MKAMIHEALTRFNELALRDKDGSRKTLAWIKVNQEKRGVVFNKKSVPTLLRPHFISHEQTALLKKTTPIVMGCLEKVVRLYCEKNAFHEQIRLGDLEQSLVSLEPGIKKVIVKARLDAFMSGLSLKFLEFNCDSPAAVAYGDVQCDIFSETQMIKKFKEYYSVEWMDRRGMMLQALLDSYHEFGGREKQPHIAIADWRDVKTRPEFFLLKDYFEAKGTPTTVVDPRELEISGNRLIAGGRPVDILYRRVIIRELLEKQDEMRPLLEAYRRKLVCVVNPIRSKIASSKSILAILTDPQFDHHFTPEQNEIKRNYIPWTRNLLPGKVVFRGKEQEPLELARKNKDNFVIKPADGYGGQDVYIGRETSTSVWEGIINKADEARIWVLQEYVDIPEEDFPIVKEGGIFIEKRKVNLNPFSIGGEYAGCLSRISLYSIINISAGGGMVPSFTIKKR